MDLNLALLSLYRALTGGSSVQGLVDIVREHFGNPISVNNCNLEPIAYSREKYIDDRIWDIVTSKDIHLHHEFEIMGKKAGLVDKVNSSREPLIIQLDMFERRYMNCAVVCGKTIMGTIELLEYYHPFNDDDRILLSEFCRVLSYYLTLKTENEYTRDPNVELVMVQLLNNDNVVPETVAQYLFQPKESAVYVVIVVDIAYKKNIRRRLLFEMETLSSDYPDAKTILYNETIVILFQTNTLRSLANINLDRLKETLESMDLVCGVSKPFDNIMELRLFYAQAKNAIAYGERYLKNERCYFYQNVTVLNLLDLAKQNSELSHFSHVALDAILEYDRVYHTKCFRTLYIWLYFNCDTSKAAEAEKINRNSMYYRLKKIQEIIPDSLEDQNFIFQMKLSISIQYILYGDTFYQENEIPTEYRVASFF